MPFLLVLILWFVSCTTHDAAQAPAGLTDEATYLPVKGLVKDTISGVPVWLIQDFDDTLHAHPTLLVLPGWNFAAERWLSETRLRQLADSMHYLLVMPEMQRSIYATHYYPETSADMRAQPTGRWVTDTLIPTLQRNYSILLPGQPNAVLGLSTGGRGALYCLWKRKDVFCAGASLSGDFNQAVMPADRLMTAVYGPYARNPQRWLHDDNLFTHAAEIEPPVFMAHGGADMVVPPAQSKDMLNRLKAMHPTQTYTSHFPPGEGHTFHFWNAELDSVFAFFEHVLPQRKP